MLCTGHCVWRTPVYSYVCHSISSQYLTCARARHAVLLLLHTVSTQQPTVHALVATCLACCAPSILDVTANPTGPNTPYTPSLVFLLLSYSSFSRIPPSLVFGVSLSLLGTIFVPHLLTLWVTPCYYLPFILLGCLDRPSTHAGRPFRYLTAVALASSLHG